VQRRRTLVFVGDARPSSNEWDWRQFAFGNYFVLFALTMSCLCLLSSCGAKPEKTSEADQHKSSDALVDAVALDRWTGDLNGMIERRKIRALVVYSKSAFFYDKGQPRGISYEALQALEAAVNKKFKTGSRPVQITFLPTSIGDVERALTEGRGDLVAVGVVVTPERQHRFDFTEPIATDVRQIIVTRANGPNLKSLNDLAGKEVFVNPLTENYQTLKRLNESLTKAGKPPIHLRASDANLAEEDLLEMTNAGLIDITVANSMRAEFWAKVYDRITVHPDLVLSSEGELAWAMRKNSPQFKRLLDEFAKTHRVGTEFGNTLLRRYLRNTKWVKNSTNDAEMRKFQTYVKYFKKYGTQYDFDYLLLAAQGYQESMLNQGMRSPRGAIGIMQVLPKTAAARPINIPDISTPENNIEAGAKVLRSIQDTYLNDQSIDPLNRTLLTFAAYNAGPTRISRLRKLAASEGLDGNKWFDNVELMVAKDVGQETVRYVGNIYKYYVAYQLAIEQAERTRQAKAALKN
jgi:membrane-bound lytic murein transglycosylase MltF